MLTIRQDQAERLADAWFARQMCAALRVESPALVAHLSDRVLLHRARASLPRARRHGFTWKSTLKAYFKLMLELGPRFDERPEFQRGLRCKLPNQRDRIRVISLAVSEEEWRTAVGANDDSDWAELDREAAEGG